MAITRHNLSHRLRSRVSFDPFGDRIASGKAQSPNAEVILSIDNRNDNIDTQIAKSRSLENEGAT